MTVLKSINIPPAPESIRAMVGWSAVTLDLMITGIRMDWPFISAMSTDEIEILGGSDAEAVLIPKNPAVVRLGVL